MSKLFRALRLPSVLISIVAILSSTGANALANTVFSFPNWEAGREANGSLVVAADGRIYGSTLGGSGRYAVGLVFALTPSPSGYVETVIHRFVGAEQIGTQPGPIVLDPAGNIWGIARKGVFELTRAAGGGWQSRLIYACSGGNYDFSTLTLRAGAIYGACGFTVIKLVPARSGYAESTLYTFTQDQPNGNLVLDDRGAIYGTTRGAAGGTQAGTVFKLTPSGSSYVRTVIHRFDFSINNIAFPAGGLFMDGSGALYGLTVWGVKPGSTNTGTFYKLTPGTSGYTMSTHFIETAYGATGTPLAGGSGEYYAAVSDGGDGYVLEFTPSGSGYKERVVHQFEGGVDGRSPVGSLSMDNAMNIFGSTWYGGTDKCFHLGCGVVFKITR